MKKLFLKMISLFLTGIVAVVSGAVFAVPAAAVSVLDEYEARQFRTKKYSNLSLPYQIHLPSDYDESKSYPLVLYLHGMGDRGNDNYAPLRRTNTMAYQLVSEDNKEKYPCIVLVPQCPVNDVWAMHFPAEISVTMDMTVELLKSVTQTYHVDQNRMYLTGFSMGGIGTWDLLLRYPDMFAAAVPMAGYAEPYTWQNAAKFKDVPLRVYHGNKDTVVNVDCSRQMVNALKKAGSNVQYFEIDGVDHEAIVTYAFYDDQLLPWMFRQKNHNTFPAFVPQGIKGKDFLSSSSKAQTPPSSQAGGTSSIKAASSSKPAGSSSSASISSKAQMESAVSSEKPVQSVEFTASGSDQKRSGMPPVVIVLLCVAAAVVIGFVGVNLYIIQKKKKQSQ